jgi:Mg2+ and Co2+ transporter CorA
MENSEIFKKIDPVYLENLDTINHFSTFNIEDNYQILILRGFSINADELSFHSRGFFINENRDLFEYIDNKLEKYDLGLGRIHEMISPIYKRNQQIIDGLILEIDKLEDGLYDRNTSRIFMDNWFDLKKDFSRIERYYSRNQIVLQSFFKYYDKEDIFPSAHFQELIQDVSYVLHNLGTQASRLDALYNYHGSLKNDKLNNNIYALTVLSAVFLPLNLIVGFFGMNTENLFFKDNPHGTQYVLLILFGAFLLAFIGIPFIKLVDKYFLRFLLGKSHVYKTVTKKVEKIENILNMDN